MLKEKKNGRNLHSAGFTMTEMLVVLAILAVLFALAVPRLAKLRKELRQKELDSKAEILYVAAQNQLSKLRAAGREDSYLCLDDGANGAARLGFVPMDSIGEDMDETTVCYVYAPSSASAAAAILPEGSADGELLSNSWVVEYEPESASVYAVFYSEEDIDYSIGAERERMNILRYKNARLNDGARVGYYGGDLVNVDITTKLDPRITVSNGEKLKAEFRCLRLGGDESTSALTFYITLDDGQGHKVEKELGSAEIEPWAANYEYIMTLDDLSNSESRFHSLFPTLEAGRPLSITLRVTSKNPLVEENSVTVVTNGLFADESTAEQAIIKYGRHLQNLDENSGVSDKVKSAQQQQDISFHDDPDTDSDWHDIYSGGYYYYEADSGYSHVGDDIFVPICNPNLELYDGSHTIERDGEDVLVYTTIYGLNTVRDLKNVGLFGEITGDMTFNSIRLSGTTALSAAGNSSSAGALIGRLTGSAELKNCQVFLTANKGELTGQTDTGYRIGADYSGGLVGSLAVSGFLSAEDSFASTVLGGESSISGGLVGRSEGLVQLRGSYADSYVTGVRVGGLVGQYVNAKAVTVTNCYTAGYLIASEKAYGLVGGAAEMTNSYAACIFEGDGDMYSTAEGGKGTNTYYMVSGNDVTGTTAAGYDTLGDKAAMATKLGTAFTSETGGYTTPYNLRSQGLTEYSFPRLKTLRHYGDWEAEFTVGEGRLVYYEKYSDGTYGFYGANVNALDNTKTITSDGYAFIRVKPGNFSVVCWNANGTASQKIPLGSKAGVPMEYEGTEYTLCPLPEEAVKITDFTGSEKYPFYHKIQIQDGNDKTVFWFNPHFACTAIASNEMPPMPEDIILRTARHLNNLSLFHDDYAEITENCQFIQERNIDYTSYVWNELPIRNTAVTSQPPIGKTADVPFSARYNGDGYTIKGVSFASDGDYVGMFGVNTGTVTNVVLLGEGKSTVSRTGIIQNRNVAVGTLAGQNDGTIRNCAVAGYTAMISTYENSTLALGGLVGRNNSFITRCSSETPKLTLNNNRSFSSVGGFVGENRGNINNAYAIAAAQVVSNQGSSKLAGFAGNNDRGSITSCYCATALIGSGTVTTYGFAPYSQVKDCTYLDQGAYTYAGEFRSYNNTNPATSGMAVRYDDMILSGSGTAAYAHPHIAEGSRFMFKPQVTDRNSQYVHYGDWPEDPGLGTLGVFYWEHETDGANNGYRLSLVGTSNNVVQYSSNLCVAHDDGGNIAEYGYGYYYDRSSMTADSVKLTASGTPAAANLSVNNAAKKALEQQLPYYEMVPFTTGTGSGELCLTGSDPNAAWTLTFKNNSYEYAVSPFFANSMSYNGSGKDKAGIYGVTPGASGHPYEVRSVKQLQFINWNSVNKDTKTLENNNTKEKFPYLSHATVTNQGTQTKNKVGGDLYWDQSHDLQGGAFSGFTPIAAQGTTSGDSSWDAVLYGWFGGSYDGGTYSIRNLNISSSAYSVGLFGTTCGAQIKNVVLYADNGTASITRTGGEKGAYALGGLIGVAYDYSSSSGREVTNCAIAGYRVIDNSTGKQTQGEANVGGLIGVADVNLNGCSAVTDIEINATHNNGHATYGDYIRVGGLTGANKDTIRNCYSGGSIKVGAATLAENRGSSGQKLSGGSTTAVYRENSTNIYIGGISGSGFTSNYKNFTNSTGQNDGKPHFVNCYTYMTLPKLEGTIRAISIIGSVADRYMGRAALSVENCYYLDSCDDAVTVPTTAERFFFSKGVYITEQNVKDMLKGNLSFLRTYISTYNIGTPTYTIDLKQLSYSELPNAALGNAFSRVTVVEKENGAPINGKYSYPAGVASLIGQNYPFRTVLTQKDRITGTPVDVHYGRWPLSSLIWDQGQVSMDILRDMNTDKTDTEHYGWCDTELTLSYEGVSPVGRELTFLYNGETSSDIAEIISQEYDSTTGTYKVLLRAKQSGFLTLTASDGSYSSSCSVEITAKINVTADPDDLRLYVYEDGAEDSDEVEFTAVSDERADGSVNDLTKNSVWSVRDFDDRVVTYTQPADGSNRFTVTAEQIGSQLLRVDCSYDYHGFPCVGSAFVQASAFLPGKVGVSNYGNITDTRVNWNEAYVTNAKKTVNGRNVGYAGVLPQPGDGLPFVYLSQEDNIPGSTVIADIMVGDEYVMRNGALLTGTENYQLFTVNASSDDTFAYRSFEIYSLSGVAETNVPLTVTLKDAKATYVLSTVIDVPAGTVHYARFYDRPNGDRLEENKWIVEQLPAGTTTISVFMIREKDDQAHHRHFIGWKDAETGTDHILVGKDSYSVDLGINKDYEYYAIWKNCFKVTFDKNCEDASVTNPSALYPYVKYNGGDADAPVNLPVLADRTDYHFMGWKVEGTADTQLVPNNNYLPTGDVKLVAVWKPIYTVKIVSDQLISVTHNSDTYTVGGTAAHSTSFKVLEGDTVRFADGTNTVQFYRFDGWYKNGGTAPSYTGGGSETITENVTWTALWTVWPTITLNGNGGTPASTTVRVAPGTLFGAVSSGWTEPTRTSYFFDGWTFDAEGKNPVPADYAFTKDETLYAVWVKSISVKFDPNEGFYTASVTMEYTNQQPGVKLSALKNHPTAANTAREHYTFLGWADSATAVTPNVNDSTEFRRTTTLYAVWQKNYVVSFVDSSGTITASSIEIIPGNPTGTLPTGSRTGYAFKGWSTDPNGDNMVNSGGFVPTGDTTLYAQWQRVIKVTFSGAPGSLYTFSSEGELSQYSGNITISVPEGTTLGEAMKYADAQFIAKYSETTGPWYSQKTSYKKGVGWAASQNQTTALDDSTVLDSYDGKTLYPVLKDCIKITIQIEPYGTTAIYWIYKDHSYTKYTSNWLFLLPLPQTEYEIMGDFASGETITLTGGGMGIVDEYLIDYWEIDGVRYENGQPYTFPDYDVTIIGHNKR